MMSLLDEGLEPYMSRGAIRSKKPMITDALVATILLTTGTAAAPLLGFISFQVDKCSSNAGYILELHVHSSVQRQQVGLHLLKEAERTLNGTLAALRTQRRFTLTVHSTNTGAKGLYEKAGYGKVREAAGSQEIWQKCIGST